MDFYNLSNLLIRDMADVLKTFIPDDLPPVVILGHR